MAPHWPETSYFNIYVVIGFDGQQQNAGGLMGYARFPDSYDYFYESFMKVATLKNLNDTTLTHELGHAFDYTILFRGSTIPTRPLVLQILTVRQMETEFVILHHREACMELLFRVIPV
jgi:hypothetical protein